MEPLFRWRMASKAVSIVHLVLATLDLVIFVLSILICALLMISQMYHEFHRTSADVKVAAGILLAIIMIMSVVVVVDCWAAFVLLVATEPEVELRYAVDKAQLWMTVMLVFLGKNCLIIGVILLINKYAGLIAFLILVFNMILRGVGVAIVNRFVRQLEMNPPGIGVQLESNSCVVQNKL